MLGINCILYRNSAALGAGYGTPTWNAVDSIRDAKISKSKNKYPTGTRAEKGLNTYEATDSEIEITCMIRLPEPAATTGDPNYDDWIVFRDAFWGNTVVHIEALTGARTVTGNIGINGFFKVTKLDEDQSNGVALFADMVLTPTHVDATTLATTPAAQAMRDVKIVSGTAQYSNFNANSFA